MYQVLLSLMLHQGLALVNLQRHQTSVSLVLELMQEFFLSVPGLVDLVFLELLLQVRTQQWVRSPHQVLYLRIPIVVRFQILLPLELVHSLWFGSDPKQQSQQSLP